MNNQPTPLWIALALSPGSKAITTLPSGTSLVVERDITGVTFTYILIDVTFSESTSYHGIDKEELHRHLSHDNVWSKPVWLPIQVTPSFVRLTRSVRSFLEELICLHGLNVCPICLTDGNVYTHSALRAHACKTCWKTWHRVSQYNTDVK